MTGIGRTRNSLFAAVFWRMGCTMLFGIALASALLFYEFASHIDNMRDRSLNGQANDILSHLGIAADGSATVDLPPSLQSAYDQTIDRPPRYVVLDRKGRLLAASPGLEKPLETGPYPVSDMARFFSLSDPISGASIYGASFTPSRFNGEITIQVSQSAEHYDVLADTLLDELLDEYLWVILLVFGAILAVTYVTLRSTLAPLTKVSEQATEIGPNTLDRRLDPEPLPSEVRPLVDAINIALDRVEDGFRIQRRFTADAAHEMRTPIALLRAHLELLETDKATDLRLDLDNLERVVSQLLKLAQVDSLKIGADEQADLGQVSKYVAEFLAPKALRNGRSIALEETDTVIVSGDPDALEVAIRNLVENALRFTPEGEDVLIKVSAHPAAVSIMDRGPGIAPEDREHLFSRFWRKDRSRSVGAGLGLSIAARIAAAHGAEISVHDRAGGGSVFRLTFSEKT
ncbi:MAG: ATP-binding protein [Alphaproteobacteria bacterium]